MNLLGMLLALAGMILYTHLKMNAPKPPVLPVVAEPEPVKPESSPTPAGAQSS